MRREKMPPARRRRAPKPATMAVCQVVACLQRPGAHAGVSPRRADIRSRPSALLPQTLGSRPIDAARQPSVTLPARVPMDHQKSPGTRRVNKARRGQSPGRSIRVAGRSLPRQPDRAFVWSRASGTSTGSRARDGKNVTGLDLLADLRVVGTPRRVRSRGHLSQLLEAGGVPTRWDCATTRQRQDATCAAAARSAFAASGGGAASRRVAGSRLDHDRLDQRGPRARQPTDPARTSARLWVLPLWAARTRLQGMKAQTFGCASATRTGWLQPMDRPIWRLVPAPPKRRGSFRWHHPAKTRRAVCTTGRWSVWPAWSWALDDAGSARSFGEVADHYRGAAHPGTASSGFRRRDRDVSMPPAWRLPTVKPGEPF